MFLAARCVVQVKHALFATGFQAVGERAAFAGVVTGHGITMGYLVAGSVMQRAAATIGFPVGLVGSKNPVVRCDRDRRIADHIEYRRDFALCPFAETIRLAHGTVCWKPIKIAGKSIAKMPYMTPLFRQECHLWRSTINKQRSPSHPEYDKNHIYFYITGDYGNLNDDLVFLALYLLILLVLDLEQTIEFWRNRHDRYGNQHA